ncbi:hypothetical protein FRC20_000920 [Serendipita sp. 405]|nr:hypothetical protein FRC15_003053 [Serendipita sp. 397]KAG8778503.1 hypothetical protein FRC16_003817 [Serendipita sp. 398]KAG8854776.1 hypothetical protein FRC20_000920 [Serendipita sp. 405]
MKFFTAIVLTFLSVSISASPLPLVGEVHLAVHSQHRAHANPDGTHIPHTHVEEEATHHEPQEAHLDKRDPGPPPPPPPPPSPRPPSPPTMRRHH